MKHFSNKTLNAGVVIATAVTMEIFVRLIPFLELYMLLFLLAGLFVWLMLLAYSAYDACCYLKRM